MPLPTSSVVAPNDSAVTGAVVSISCRGVRLPTRQITTLPSNAPVAKNRPSGLQAASCQLMLPRQRLDQATGAVVETHTTVAAGDEEPIAVRRERREDDVAAELKDPRLAHRGEARAEDVRGLPSGGELRSLQRELDADLRVRGDVRERMAGERAAMGMPRLRARVAPLDERKYSHGGDQGQGDKAGADDREQPAMLTACADLLAAQLVLGLPGEDRRPEDVVEDLVARRHALHAVDAADDPLAPEPLEQAPQLGILDVRVLGEVGGLVRDLPYPTA